MIDLHVHSTCSDGTDTPKRLVEIAAAAGCKTFALTDHDTISGIEEATVAGASHGITVIPGVELSCHVGDRSVHLLGYFVDVENDEFLQFLRRQRELRNQRNEILCAKLAAIGVHLEMSDVLQEAGGEAVGRPHFAAALVRIGEATSIADAFARFLGDGAPTHVTRIGLLASAAISAIHDAGGLVSWAHPLTGRHGKTGFDSCLDSLIKAGLDGIESWYSTYSVEERSYLASIALRHNLIATGGSDYHGQNKPHISFGIGTGDLTIPSEAFQQLTQLRVSRSR